LNALINVVVKVHVIMIMDNVLVMMDGKEKIVHKKNLMMDALLQILKNMNHIALTELKEDIVIQ